MFKFNTVFSSDCLLGALRLPILLSMHVSQNAVQVLLSAYLLGLIFTNSFLLLLIRHLFIVAWHLFLVGYCSC